MKQVSCKMYQLLI